MENQSLDNNSEQQSSSNAEEKDFKLNNDENIPITSMSSTETDSPSTADNKVRHFKKTLIMQTLTDDESADIADSQSKVQTKTNSKMTTKSVGEDKTSSNNNENTLSNVENNCNMNEKNNVDEKKTCPPNKMDSINQINDESTSNNDHGDKMEVTKTADEQVIQNGESKFESEQESESEKNTGDDDHNEHNQQTENSDQVMIAENEDEDEVKPSDLLKVDFSIKSLSGRNDSSDDESKAFSSRGDESACDSEDLNTTNGTNVTGNKDDGSSSKNISNNSEFDFRRPSIGGLVNSSSSVLSPSSTNSNTNYGSVGDIPQMVTHVGRKPLNGPPCSLKTLVDDGILSPMDGALTYEIMGSKFTGDLLANGFIRTSGTSHIFANPSSWANYCRLTLSNTVKDHKTFGSAWSIIRYLGKRLDSYKLRWYRKQKKQYHGPSLNFNENGGASVGHRRRSSGGNSMTNGHGDMYPHLTNNGTLPINNHTSNMNGSFNSSHLFNTQSLMTNGHEMKSLSSYMSRDRLWKFDKLSIGDVELNNEDIHSESEVINFTTIDLENKDSTLKDGMKVAAVPFNSVLCLQPFSVTVATNVFLLVDFHSHMISGEIYGYLGGHWDSRGQHLTIIQAFPMFSPEVDSEKMQNQIANIKKSLQCRSMSLVGWYHSHVDSVPHPSVADIKRQLSYQKAMISGAGQKINVEYQPVVGLITSPYYKKASNLASLNQLFWVMPLFVHNCRDFGRPMQLAYNTVRDHFLTQDLLVEMRLLATHFSSHSKVVDFSQHYQWESSNWEKFQESLKSKLPRDLLEFDPNDSSSTTIQALTHFWQFVKGLLYFSNSQSKDS